jgi:hypothetical protein
MAPLHHHGLFFSIVVDQARDNEELGLSSLQSSLFHFCTPQGHDNEEVSSLSLWFFFPMLHTLGLRRQGARLLIIVVFFFPLLHTQGHDDEKLNSSSLWFSFFHCYTPKAVTTRARLLLVVVFFFPAANLRVVTMKSLTFYHRSFFSLLHTLYPHFSAS